MATKKQYTQEQFFEDVRKEAELLKKHATAKELKKLNIEKFDPINRMNCVYGQMTGECRSERAISLITKCCKRFVSTTFGVDDLTEGEEDERTTYDRLKQFINGTKSKRPCSITYLSAIEGYILLRDEKWKNLIDYLRGARKDLIL